MTRQGVLWASAALLGIIATAVIAWSVSQVTGQRIGLASAPLSVVRGLAPAHHRRHHVDRVQRRTVTVTVPAPTPPTPPSPPAAVVPPAALPAPAPVAAPTRHAGGDGSGDGGGGSHRDD